jgi:hypothetical protein
MAQGQSRQLFGVVGSFVTCSGGDQGWSYDHSDKCEGNQKVMHEMFSPVAAI